MKRDGYVFSDWRGNYVKPENMSEKEIKWNRLSKAERRAEWEKERASR